jgi:hypothetical protein
LWWSAKIYCIITSALKNSLMRGDVSFCRSDASRDKDV